MDSSGDTILLIGLGSNREAQRWVPRALRLLRDHFAETRVSTLYATRPLHGLAQPPYVNGVVAARTVMSVAAVRAALRAIEYQCGRVRDPRERCASRTMDLDLLAFGTARLEAVGLPAPELLERDFCLIPAAELLPEWVHPAVGKTLRHLAAERFPTPPNLIAPVRFGTDH